VSLVRKVSVITLSLVCSSLLVACASSSIIVGIVKPTLLPEQVKIYRHPPKKYSEIAIIESSSDGSWSFTAQGKMDVVIQRLKEEAAKHGANGMLFQGTVNENSASMVTTSTGTTIASNATFCIGIGGSYQITGKSGNGMAIFVEEE